MFEAVLCPACQGELDATSFHNSEIPPGTYIHFVCQGDCGRSFDLEIGSYDGIVGATLFMNEPVEEA